MDVEVKHHLSPGTLVELLDGDAVGVEDLDGGARDLLRSLHHVGKVGRIDVYQTPAHGREPSKAVSALAPRVAVADNGARKGAAAAAVKAFQAMPGLENLWLLHMNVASGAEGNPSAEFIANLDEPGSGDQGAYLKLSAMQDGSFTIFNSRTKTTKTYARR